MIPRTFEQLESTVTTHESLLQLEISEDLLVYLNDQVPELQQVIREDFQVIGCTQNQKGFYCKIIIRQEDTGNIGYQLGAVPFMYDGTIFDVPRGPSVIGHLMHDVEQVRRGLSVQHVGSKGIATQRLARCAEAVSGTARNAS